MYIEFLTGWILLASICMLMFHWKDMNEFAQGLGLICLCCGMWGQVLTIIIVSVATSVPRHND